MEVNTSKEDGPSPLPVVAFEQSASEHLSRVAAERLAASHHGSRSLAEIHESDQIHEGGDIPGFVQPEGAVPEFPTL